MKPSYEVGRMKPSYREGYVTFMIMRLEAVLGLGGPARAWGWGGGSNDMII